jgi:hypothetical protein
MENVYQKVVLFVAIFLIPASEFFPNFSSSQRNQEASSAEASPSRYATSVWPINYIESGDLIFREGQGFWSSFFKVFNESYGFTHVGVLLVDRSSIYVLHSEADDISLRGVVRKDSLSQFLGDSDRYQFMKNVLPIMAKNRFLTEVLLMHQVSTPFDSLFDLGDDGRSVYCSELIWVALKRAGLENLVATDSIANKQVVRVDAVYSSKFLSSF